MSVCTLCGLALTKHPIVEKMNVFCCHGCHAVYQILSIKNSLENYSEHPIFLQAVEAGLISNPLLLDAIQQKQVEETAAIKEKLCLEIQDMWCPSCAELIRLVLLQERGVVSCIVDYPTDLAAIEFSPMITSKERIQKKISSLGYAPSSLDSAEKTTISRLLYYRFIIASFCSLNVMMFAYPLYATYFNFDDQGYGHLFAWLSLWISLPVVTFCAWPIFRRFWSGLFVGLIGMEALVSLGVIAAFIFSLYNLLQGSTEVYFDSMTVIIVFVLLGKIIETKAKFSAKNSLLRLHKNIPRKGRKKTESGEWRFVPLKEIAVGDSIQVLTGEKVILDGLVVKGSGICDESIMTGESMPVLKETGSRVLSGSLLLNGHLEVLVQASSEETSFQRILQMIEKDISKKCSYVRQIDSVIRWFVPAIIAMALAVYILCLPLGFETALLRMISVLLISCPCAIGIAVPLAESHLMHAFTNRGVVIRNRGVLKYLGKETAYVFDKTGTVTKGTFDVISGLEEISKHDLLVLNSMCRLSMHPISLAIAKKINLPPIELSVKEIIGKGIQAKVDEDVYYFGSSVFLEQQGIQLKKKPADHTTVYFGKGTEWLAEIALGDFIKPEAISLVELLAPLKCILLSGDGYSTVKAVAKICGIKQWIAGATPLEKKQMIEDLKAKGEIVCFLGDGINDSPSLTTAHVGISVISAADISIQVSDILLTTDKLTIIQEIRLLAIKGNRIINQNLFWAFFYNIIGIAFAAAGLLTPIFAAAAMVISSLMVLFNAQRLSGPTLSRLTDPSKN